MSARRILITGASGLVGGALARLSVGADREIVGLVHRFAGSLPAGVHRESQDLTELPRLRAWLDRFQPHAIFNAAAISEPGGCDADPALAHRLNVAVPEALAAWCEQHQARLIHLSTEQVFGGDRAPYRFTDPVAPLQRYGQLKAESERVVQRAAPAHAVTVRLPLLLGRSPSGARSANERLLADWSGRKTARLFRDEIRQVAHADNVAAALLELLEHPRITGVVHWAGAEPVSRFELGERLRRAFGLTAEQAPIEGITRHEVGEAAQTRPADLRFDLAPLDRWLQTRPETLDQQLARLTAVPTAPDHAGQQAQGARPEENARSS